MATNKYSGNNARKGAGRQRTQRTQWNGSVFAAFLLIAVATAGFTASASAESGIASIYSGRRAANGAGGMTAAHRSLPFGTMVRVTNKKNGNSVVVRINDRGPFIRGRVIDVTKPAARALGFSGLAPVSLALVGGGN